MNNEKEARKKESWMLKENKQKWNELLPTQVNNEFTGFKFTLYIFYIITGMTIIRSMIHILFPDGGAGTIASINVSVEGGQIIISIFAFWGLSQLLFGMFYLIVCFRYKNLIPLMYLFILVEYSFRIVIGLIKPIETMTIAPGAIGNLILVPLSLLMLIFSLRIQKNK